MLAPFQDIPFPTPRLPEVSAWQAFVDYPVVRALAPLPVLLLIAPVIWAFFRKSWQEIEVESRELRARQDGAID